MPGSKRFPFPSPTKQHIIVPHLGTSQCFLWNRLFVFVKPLFVIWLHWMMLRYKYTCCKEQNERWNECTYELPCVKYLIFFLDLVNYRTSQEKWTPLIKLNLMLRVHVCLSFDFTEIPAGGGAAHRWKNASRWSPPSPSSPSPHWRFRCVSWCTPMPVPVSIISIRISIYVVLSRLVSSLDWIIHPLVVVHMIYDDATLFTPCLFSFTTTTHKKFHNTHTQNPGEYRASTMNRS